MNMTSFMSFAVVRDVKILQLGRVFMIGRFIAERFGENSTLKRTSFSSYAFLRRFSISRAFYYSSSSSCKSPNIKSPILFVTLFVAIFCYFFGTRLMLMTDGSMIYQIRFGYSVFFYGLIDREVFANFFLPFLWLTVSSFSCRFVSHVVMMAAYLQWKREDEV